MGGGREWGGGRCLGARRGRGGGDGDFLRRGGGGAGGRAFLLGGGGWGGGDPGLACRGGGLKRFKPILPPPIFHLVASREYSAAICVHVPGQASVDLAPSHQREGTTALSCNSDRIVSNKLLESHVADPAHGIAMCPCPHAHTCIYTHTLRRMWYPPPPHTHLAGREHLVVDCNLPDGTVQMLD